MAVSVFASVFVFASFLVFLCVFASVFVIVCFFVLMLVLVPVFSSVRVMLCNSVGVMQHKDSTNTADETEWGGLRSTHWSLAQDSTDPSARRGCVCSNHGVTFVFPIWCGMSARARRSRQPPSSSARQCNGLWVIARIGHPGRRRVVAFNFAC